MTHTLAAKEDAIVILKLYELRTDPLMRKARDWITVRFWPKSAEEIQTILNDFGSEENAFFRQVTTYWEMAAALVNHGTLDPELFAATVGEPFFLLAKFWPFLGEIRATAPHFMSQVEQLTAKSTVAKERFEALKTGMEKRRARTATP